MSTKTQQPDLAAGLVDDPALTNLAAIPTRKTLMLVNDFISNTVDFMNKFSTLCEQKLAKVSLQTQRLEIMMSLLEAKLESVPLNETDYQAPAQPQQQQQQPPPQQQQQQQQDEYDSSHDQQQQPPPPPPPSSSTPQPPPPQQTVAAAPPPQPAAPAPAAPTEDAGGKQPIKKDPRYGKYFNLLSYGANKEAVVMRMQAESDGSLDPAVLDMDPNTLVDLPYSP